MHILEEAIQDTFDLQQEGRSIALFGAHVANLLVFECICTSSSTEGIKAIETGDFRACRQGLVSPVQQGYELSVMLFNAKLMNIYLFL